MRWLALMWVLFTLIWLFVLRRTIQKFWLFCVCVFVASHWDFWREKKYLQYFWVHVHSFEYDLNLLQWNSVLALLSEFQMGCLCKTNDSLPYLRGKEFWVRKRTFESASSLPSYLIFQSAHQRTSSGSLSPISFSCRVLAEKDRITSGWHLDGNFLLRHAHIRTELLRKVTDCFHALSCKNKMRLTATCLGPICEQLLQLLFRPIPFWIIRHRVFTLIFVCDRITNRS